MYKNISLRFRTCVRDAYEGYRAPVMSIPEQKSQHTTFVHWLLSTLNPQKLQVLFQLPQRPDGRAGKLVNISERDSLTK